MIRSLLTLAFVAIASLAAEEPKLPPAAVPLLPDTPLRASQPKPEEGTIERVESAGAPTKAVWRLTSPGKLEKSYNLSMSRTFTQPIAKGQVCLAVIKARTAQTDKADGRGRVTFAVQNTKDYEATVLWTNWVIGKEWETAFFAFEAGNEVPEGAGVAKLNVGETRQVIEVADFQVYRFPVGFRILDAPQMVKTYEGREPDAPWRKEAEQRIAKLRQGTLNVRVADADGKPVEGARIHVAMKRHLFGFGSAVDPVMLSALDQKLAPDDQRKYRDTVDALFSRIVPENGLRVRQIDVADDPARPWATEYQRRNRAATLWMLQWAQDRRMTTRGHYLVWGYLEEWARKIVNERGVDGLLETYDRHFAFVLPFCAPYVTEWDALNHPVPFYEPDALYNVIGPDFYRDIYRKIRAQTDKLLFVNEDAFNPDRADGFEKHVRHMIEKGATPDGAGFQSHYQDASIPSVDEVWRNYERMAALVKYLTVTEYDLQTLDDQLHADHLRDMLTLAFSHPQMTGFVIWGFWEMRHWKPTAAMFRADWSERPAVKVWRDLVKREWWTNAELTSGADGRAGTPGYFGWYDITVEHGGKTAVLEVKHATSGSAPTVKLP